MWPGLTSMKLTSMIFVTIPQSCSIRTKYLFEMVFWLAVYTPKLFNQNKIFIWNGVLIGCFFSNMNTSFMTKTKDLYGWKFNNGGNFRQTKDPTAQSNLFTIGSFFKIDWSCLSYIFIYTFSIINIIFIIILIVICNNSNV